MSNFQLTSFLRLKEALSRVDLKELQIENLCLRFALHEDGVIVTLRVLE